MGGCHNYWFFIIVVVASLTTFETFGAISETNNNEDNFGELHHMMDSYELALYFGVTESHEVDASKYQVASIHKRSMSFNKRNGQSHSIEFGLQAFGKRFNIRMKRNDHLVAKTAKIITRNGGEASKIFPEPDSTSSKNSSKTDKMSDKMSAKPRLTVMDPDEMDDWPTDDDDCGHYSGDNGAFSDCDEGLRGFFIDYDNDPNYYMDVQPLTKRLSTKTSIRNQTMSFGGEKPHIITINRLSINRTQFRESKFVKNDIDFLRKDGSLMQARDKRRGRRRKTIETALFLDEKAYRMYDRFYNGDKRKIREVMLTYMNGIQALYHFPSLGEKIDFSIVHMELFKRQPSNMRTHGGERNDLLTSFCKYQGELNPDEDSNPRHWDIGLYVSGEDFWALDTRGRRSYITMGLATVTGICSKKYGCVIGEIGVRDRKNKPYPSASFVSIYVMGHEIAHNLGMFHDSSHNSCDKNGYIMSPSRGTKGETVWSTCSARVIRELDLECLEEDNPTQMKPDDNHSKYGDVPGRMWTADEQCQWFMLDKGARVDHTRSDMSDICQAMKCRSPSTSGYYRHGPALEGTTCGNGRVCQYGDCIPLRMMVTEKPQSGAPNLPVAGGSSSGGGSSSKPGSSNNGSNGGKSQWSDWIDGSCETGCIKKSVGIQKRTRFCIVSKPVDSVIQCPGKQKTVRLCDTYPKCRGHMPLKLFADTQCKRFIESSKELEKKIEPKGKQSSHNFERLEQACTVHCKRKHLNNFWYAPKLELNDNKDVSVYFPDGTWCHNDGSVDYYCQENQCRTSSARGGRSEPAPDLDLLQNADPEGERKIPDELEKYFSIDDQDKPLGNSLEVTDVDDNDDKWEDDDFLLVP